MVRRLSVLAALTLAAGALVPASAAPASASTPAPVVIAHIDTGINPYHEEFRDTTPLAYAHPSTYIPGYPATTPALQLSLGEATWQEAFDKDKATWEAMRRLPRGTMYWIPGTRIVAAISMGGGGTFCPVVSGVAPAPNIVNAASCVDYPILDDHGHGTMTASRMAGATTSQCPTCRIVSIEGLGVGSVTWAADQGWIDIQSNSWGNLVPDPVASAVSPRNRAALEAAAQKSLVVFASGNGAGFIFGFTTWPTQLQANLVEGALWVGAHDNGRVTAWSGAPAHLVADGYGGLAATKNSLTGAEANPFSCCTSAAAPYAAGVAANALTHARNLLGDTATGVRGTDIARGTPVPGSVPLEDGVLTLDELRSLVQRTAEPRPAEGEHDGALNWTGGPAAPNPLPYGPAENPYCVGCTTMPVQWTELPESVPAYPLVGYGASNERSATLARAVLTGDAFAPNRTDVDAFFAHDRQVRGYLKHLRS